MSCPCDPYENVSEEKENTLKISITKSALEAKKTHAKRASTFRPK